MEKIWKLTLGVILILMVVPVLMLWQQISVHREPYPRYVEATYLGDINYWHEIRINYPGSNPGDLRLSNWWIFVESPFSGNIFLSQAKSNYYNKSYNGNFTYLDVDNNNKFSSGDILKIRDLETGGYMSGTITFNTIDGGSRGVFTFP